VTRETDDFRRWADEWKGADVRVDVDAVLTRVAARRRSARLEQFASVLRLVLLSSFGVLALIWFGTKNPAGAFILSLAGVAFGWSIASRRALGDQIAAAPSDHVRELRLREQDLATRYARSRWIFWAATTAWAVWVVWTFWSHAAVFRDEPWMLLRAAFVVLGVILLAWAASKRAARKAVERLAVLDELTREPQG
jgi:hypothetical protein